MKLAITRMLRLGRMSDTSWWGWGGRFASLDFGSSSIPGFTLRPNGASQGSSRTLFIRPLTCAGGEVATMPDSPSPMDQLKFSARFTDDPASHVSASWWRTAPRRRDATGATALNDQSDRLPFLALLLFTALLFLSPQSFFPALVPLRLAFVAGCFALGSYLLQRLLHGRP